MRVIIGSLSNEGAPALDNWQAYAIVAAIAAVAYLLVLWIAALVWTYRDVQERTRDNLRRIILLTDRPIEGAELYDRSRTLDYPFSAIELLVDDTGHGKGDLWIAAKLTLLDDLLIVDNYADRPVTLSDVRRGDARTP